MKSISQTYSIVLALFLLAGCGRAHDDSKVAAVPKSRIEIELVTVTVKAQITADKDSAVLKGEGGLPENLAYPSAPTGRFSIDTVVQGDVVYHVLSSIVDRHNLYYDIDCPEHPTLPIEEKLTITVFADGGVWVMRGTCSQALLEMEAAMLNLIRTLQNEDQVGDRGWEDSTEIARIRSMLHTSEDGD